MMISMIAAYGSNRAIGFGNKLPWYIPGDLKRFKALTTGHPIIMGRKTYDSIGRALPNRTNIVVTRDPNFTADGCIITHSLIEALEKAKQHDNEEIFIIGGAQIYELGLPYANKMYLTHVDIAPDVDAFFPAFASHGDWKVVHEEKHEVDESNLYSYTYRIYERKET